MTEQVRTGRVERDPAAVWAVLADFAAISRWAPNVDHSVLLRTRGDDRELGVGTVRRIQSGRSTVLERVVAWDEPATLAYEIEGLPPVVRSARNTWRLAPDGAGATEVSLTTAVDCGPRPPQLLLARLVARRLARESEALLAGLARSQEAVPHG